MVTSLLMQVDDLPSYTVVVAASNHSELLDRAVWRRFQIRLELPAPTQAQLARYFDAFARKTDQPLGRSAESIAKSLATSATRKRKSSVTTSAGASPCRRERARSRRW